MDARSTRSHYEVLRVSPTCSLEEMKRAYQRLLLLHHPDKRAAHSEEMSASPLHMDEFLCIQQSWEVLSNGEESESDVSSAHFWF